jgi:dTDP-4-amino-4,6-dideoxygalactose transaminase
MGKRDRTMEDLNMHMSQPKKIIRLSKSCIGSEEKAAVLEVLSKEYLGMGVEVREFEVALSDYFGRPALCVTNGTAALQLAIQSCGIGSGDEVLVPSLTYVASFQAIRACGAKPVACDINPDTLMISINDAEKRLTAKTKAIMPVHYTGAACDIPAVYEFAKRYNLRVIEDAAHAFGSKFNGQRIGSFGDISCFSFDGIKNITSGEGGCIVTNDVNVLEKIQDARLLGVEKDTEKRLIGQRSWEFNVVEQGWRYHMSNIMAAIGLTQIRRFEEFASIRQNIAKLYDTFFKNNNRIQCMPNDYNTVVPHIYVVRIKGLFNRKELQDRLMQKGIQTGIHYQPSHWLSFFKDENALPLTVTDKIYPSLLTLPLHAEITNEDVQYIVNVLTSELEHV